MKRRVKASRAGDPLPGCAGFFCFKRFSTRLTFIDFNSKEMELRMRFVFGGVHS
jgi:hypothetical protein